jgi:hypothetical protein
MSFKTVLYSPLLRVQTSLIWHLEKLLLAVAGLQPSVAGSSQSSGFVHACLN